MHHFFVDALFANGAYQRQTYIYKNVWGELTRVRQWGSQNGFSVNQSRFYYYNDKRQICRYRENEGGDTVFEYDAAGWLIAFQKGLGNGSACATPTGTAKVSLIRDGLGRITKTDFADAGTPDIRTVYDAVGKVLELDRGTTELTYAYDPLSDLLTSESLAIDGRQYALTYDYNNAGIMTSKTLPSGRLVSFNPDGLGRAREAKSGTTRYAHGVTYHPSGQIASFNYHHGFVFNQILNERQLPERISAIKGTTTAVDFTYTYDNRGLITSMQDGAIADNNRSYQYDGLGQLVSASGPWGAGSYTYDSLGNVRHKQLGARSITLNYDTHAQL